MIKYYRLNDIKERGAITVQREVFENNRIYRVFQSHTSLESFLDYYQDIDPLYRNFYEVIYDEDQKFYVDLETTNDEINEFLWNMYVEELVSVILDYLNTRYYLRYNSKDELNIKKSTHVIFPHVYVKSCSISKRILREVSKCLEDFYNCKECEMIKSIIDYSMYKKVQLFRIEGSCKINQNRVKYVSGYDEISDSFNDGLISNVDYKKAKLFTEEMFIYDEDTYVEIPVGNSSQ
ncbi:hypothetical protein HDU92_007762 [Lobulomyces angularis]|nr:hypothetical protein HDU92_007762 [Lobulomyces angularis]